MERVKDVLSEAVCENGVYDEGIIGNEVDKVQIFDVLSLFAIKMGHKRECHSRNIKPYDIHL